MIQKSSNVGTVKMAMQMQPREMWELFSAVGFGQKPQIEFPGAVTGRLRPYKTWRPIEQATMSYGYGLSASLFQLARAYTVFAHDGELLPVSILRADRRRTAAPAPACACSRRRRRRRCATCCSWPPATGGTAPQAQTMGYSVGGKTGTAHKQEGKGYAQKKYRAWFVGLAPVDEPAHRRRGDGRRAEQRQVLRRRRGRPGVQPKSCSRRCARWACSRTWT